MSALKILSLALLASPLHAEDTPQQTPYMVYQEVQSLNAEIQTLEKTIADSEAREKNLKEEVANAFPLLVRTARRNPLEILARPRSQHEIARERALISSVTHHLSELKRIASQDVTEQKIIQDDNLKNLTIKKEALAEIIALHRAQIEEEKARLAELERAEQTRLSQKKMSVNELLNESQTARGKKPILPASHEGLPILRLDTPIRGKIVGLYDYQKKYSKNSKGVVFESDKGAPIVAPAHGVVKYVGKFAEHDPIIILDHGEKTTTILIGAESVSVQPGQSIYMGQTLGKLPGYGATAPRLYMEFRNKGKYIDPTPFFSDNEQN